MSHTITHGDATVVLNKVFTSLIKAKELHNRGAKEANGICPHSKEFLKFGFWLKQKLKERRVFAKQIQQTRARNSGCFGACLDQVTVQTENYGSSLKWLQKVMALDSR